MTVNIKAYEEFVLSCENYLSRNGWKLYDKNRWIVPEQFGIHAGDVYLFNNAVEFQLENDRERR